MNEDENDEHEIRPVDRTDEEDAQPSEESEYEKFRDDVRRYIGFRPHAGFVQPLFPNVDGLVPKVILPWQDHLRSVLPDYRAVAHLAFAGNTQRLQEQVASMAAAIPKFTVQGSYLPSLKAQLLAPETESQLRKVAEQHVEALDGLRKSLGSLFDPNAFLGINRALLPPNLKDYADEIRAQEVYEFVRMEGIPLFMVPRGRTALRLLQAGDRAARRQVMGDCYESLIIDCAAVLKAADHKAISSEASFALDGLGAMRAGYTRSAQAMFTVTLDSLIYCFYSDKDRRKVVTNRRKGATVPEGMEEMGAWEALVWLPIWNAHEQFWKDKGDKVPHYYSRHATVHGVSPRQFSKRNCVQVLMLVTSLIAYADRLARDMD